MTRARLILNPASGADRASGLLPVINSRLRSRVQVLDVTITVDDADTERAAMRAVEERDDALFIAGGDGTLNAVLRGLLDGGRSAHALPLGLIPLGTGNDFAKALDLGEEPLEALERLVATRVVEVDAGTLNGRPFVNTSAGGFVAEVSEAVTEGLKDATGKLAYLIGGVRALLGSEPFATRLRLRGTPGSPDVEEALALQMFAICNARMIGGGYPISPGALLDDGLLDVYFVERVPLLEFIAILQAIAGGTHEQDAHVRHFRAASFDLRFDRRVRVNTDGELFEADACEYRVLPKALRFFSGPQPCTLAAPVKL